MRIATDGSRGMQVSDNAQLSFTRGLVSGNRGCRYADTIATFEDVVIEDTQEQASDGIDGGGWRLTLALKRAVLYLNRDLGVLVSSESIATFEDVVIEDAQEQASAVVGAYESGCGGACC